MLRLGFDGERDEHDRTFAEFYTVHGAKVRSMAYLLCGDWHRAEDLTQIVFTKLYRSWRRIYRRDEVPQSFVRQTLIRAFLDERRRPWRREVMVGDYGHGLSPPVEDPDVPTNVAIRRVVAQLPARQRAVLVLRYWEDLSFEQVAQVLGCPIGTVRSLATRGVQALRRALDLQVSACAAKESRQTQGEPDR